MQRVLDFLNFLIPLITHPIFFFEIREGARAERSLQNFSLYSPSMQFHAVKFLVEEIEGHTNENKALG